MAWMRRWLAPIGCWLAYVVGASSLGVLPTFQGDLVAWATGWWWLWTISPWASTLFLLGLTFTGVIAFEVARRDNWGASILSGFVGAWLTFVVSELSLPGTSPQSFWIEVTWQDEVWMTTVFGGLGIMFAALAPLGLVVWLEVRQGRRGAEGSKGAAGGR